MEGRCCTLAHLQNKDYSEMRDAEWKKIDPPMLPPRDTHVQLAVMEEAHAILDNVGLRHWLVDGALIHVVRDKKLKPYNQDIDYACYAEDIAPLSLELRKQFLLAGYAVRAKKRNTRLDCWKHGEMVSIQGYIGGGKFRWMKNKRIPARYFENDEIVEFNGVSYNAPMISKYLSWKYSNWKKPYKGDTKNKCYLNKKRLVGHK